MNEIIKKTCCEELRLIRQELKLSMTKMAKLLGYGGSSSYQYYEDEDLYKKPYFERSFINKLLKQLVPMGIEAKRIEKLAGDYPEDVSNGLSDAEVALTDVLKDIIQIILHHNLCTAPALSNVLDYQRAHYEEKDLPNAIVVIDQLISSVLDRSTDPEKLVLKRLFRLPPPVV